MTSWRLRLARVFLIWETIWPALWPVVALLLGFLVLTAFDLLPLLPVWAHKTILIAALLAGAVSLVMGFRGLSPPSSAAARRRLERDSGLDHRPLAALRDTLAVAGGDPFTEALWTAHHKRMAAAASSLRLSMPRAGFVNRDPYAIRAILTLLLGIGLLWSGADFWPRVSRALHPGFGTGEALAAIGYDVWITPPDYTGVPPIYLGSELSEQPKSGPLTVPVGSTVLARVHGGRVPTLELGKKTVAFNADGETEFSATAPVGEASELSLMQDGSTLVTRALKLIPDQPPSVEWNGVIGVTPQASLQLSYLAKDDYGIKSLTLIVTYGKDKPVEIPIALPSRAKQIKASTYQDLTASRWAGSMVELRFRAADAIDQTGTSSPFNIKLPERNFHNPVAKAVVEQRKLLMHDPTQEDVVAETLSDLSEKPSLFNNDLSAYLGLRAATARLGLDANHGDLESIEQLMWDTALRIEDGDMPEAQKSLRQAQQALQDALDRKAPDAEVEALMRQLEQAVQRYLQAMAANAPPPNGQPNQSDSRNSVSAQDIQKMLDQAREMARTGARDAAKQALNNLQNLLESLKAGQSQPGQSGPEQKAMQEMQNLARKQQELLDKSYRAAQRNGAQQGGQNGQPQNQPGQGQPGQGQPGQGASGQNGQSAEGSGDQKAGDGNTPGGLAAAQEALRRELGEAMRQAGENGELPQAAGRADRAMKNATGALQGGKPGDAVGQQSEALDQLQQAMREMSEKMGQNSGQGTQQQAGKDPFGRAGNGKIDGGDVKLPTAVDMQRSREILDELRRRAGEQGRPRIDRDYVNRLLQRF